MFYAASKIKYGKPDPAKMFGVGRMEKLQRGPAPPCLRAAYVKFVRGAHTRWHPPYHHGEQLLLVAQGKGSVEFQNLPTLKIRKGDRVFVPAGALHRHGALEGETMIHLAVTTGETIWETVNSSQSTKCKQA